MKAVESSTIAEENQSFHHPFAPQLSLCWALLTLVMDSIEFEFGSEKNIPLASRKEYMEMMIQALEKFNRNISSLSFVIYYYV